jgi:hypothetical protein
MGRWLELIETALAKLSLSFPEIIAFLVKLSIAEAVVIGIGVAGVCVLYVVTVGYFFPQLRENKVLLIVGGLFAGLAGYFVIDEALHRWWGHGPSVSPPHPPVSSPLPSVSPPVQSVSPPLPRTSSCAAISSSTDCNNRDDCVWSTTSNSCSGYPLSGLVAVGSFRCSIITNKDDCNRSLCFWSTTSNSCSLFANPLSNLPAARSACSTITNKDTCNNRSDCAWSTTSNSCSAFSPVVPAVPCGIITDNDTCNNRPECVWSSNSCSAWYNPFRKRPAVR